MAIDTLDTDLVATKRNRSEITLSTVVIPSRLRKYSGAFKITAYFFVFLFSLLLFLVVKIPEPLVTGYVLQTLNTNTPFRWQSDKISLKLFLLPHFNFDKIEAQPKIPGQGYSFAFDTLSISPSLMSLIPRSQPNIGASFSGGLSKGTVSGHIKLDSSAAMDINAENIDLSKLATLEDAGIDMKGILQKVAINLVLESQKMSRADGEVKFSGKNMILDPATFQLPMPLPILELGPIDFSGKVRNGKLHIERATIGDASKDLDLKLEGDIQLRDPVLLSQVDLKMQIKPSNKIKAAVPALEGMLNLMAALKPTGFYASKISGTLGTLGVPTPDK